MAKCSSISTGQLKSLPILHFQPIDLVVFQGTVTKPYLGRGFVLRCFQHLSSPYLATLRCHGRDNWSTIGSFTSALSY